MNEPGTSAAANASAASHQGVVRPPMATTTSVQSSQSAAAAGPPPPSATDSDLEPGDDEGADADDDSEPDDGFFFESDHLALRGNADYTAVLRTIAILQTQRMQVTRSIDQLAAAERRALDAPDEFLRQLVAGQLQLPGSLAVAELPVIDFDKYGVAVPDFVPDEEAAVVGGAGLASSGGGGGSGGFATEAAHAVAAGADPSLVVRGRMFDQSKPETFNQLWTVEEQKRLEELLIAFPPEAVEMRRFAKIARALGNRTTKQVASRLQKYFKKLHSAGMPVPGRIPKSNRAYVSKANRMHRQAMRTTTFFPANHVPYQMVDEEDDALVAAAGGWQLDSNWYRRGCAAEGPSGGERRAAAAEGEAAVWAERRTYVVDDGGGGGGGDGVKVEGNGDDEQQRALVLRLAMRIKADKERGQPAGERGGSEHVGFRCDRCSEDPICGTRWHCQTCTTDSLDFCSDCLLTQLQLPADQRHPIGHHLVAMRVTHVDGVGDPDGGRRQSDEAAGGYLDPDTERFEYRYIKSEFNYMDPNFMPQ